MSQYMTHGGAKSYATKAAAARILGISRRTVQRNCRIASSMWLLDPPLTDSTGNVSVSLLKRFMEIRRTRDGRGWKAGTKRPVSQPHLLGTERVRKTVGRGYLQRLENIRQEIAAMSDGEQVSLLLHWSRKVFSEMFREVPYQRAKTLAPQFKEAARRVGKEANYISGWSWLD